MYTLEDYLFFRGDLSFDLFPVNEIDEMVFAAMGKPDYSGILRESDTALFTDIFSEYMTQTGKKDNDKLGLLESSLLIQSLRAVMKSQRYKDVRISHFINKVSIASTEQISALTVLIPDGTVFVTFRGTDDTLVGWKENCELAVMDCVPAQLDATVYLDKVAAEYQGPIIVSGHSKGGNLAVYAAASVRKEIQDRIRKVISYDGPGFMDCFFKSSGYSAIESKVTTFVPKSSIVGMLMHHAGDLEIVECQKDGPGAHDIFMWNVNAFGLERSDILAKKSFVFHQAVNQTLDSMDVTERQELIDEIFEVLTCTGAFQLTDYTEHSVANAVKMAGKFNKSKEIKQFLLLLSKLSIKGAVSSIGKGKEFGEDDLCDD